MITKQEIDKVFKVFRRKCAIKVSTQAQAIIFHLMNAIETDPDPKWNPSHNRPLIQEQLLRLLPQTLERLAQDRNIEPEGEITTFDVFAWGGERYQRRMLSSCSGGWNTDLEWLQPKPKQNPGHEGLRNA